MSNSNQTLNLLSHIYADGQTTIDAMEEMIDKASDNYFKYKLLNLQNEQKNITNTACTHLGKYGKAHKELLQHHKTQPPDISSGSEHDMADSLIKSYSEGIECAKKTISYNEDANSEAKMLADQYVQLQYQQMQDISNFL